MVVKLLQCFPVRVRLDLYADDHVLVSRQSVHMDICRRFQPKEPGKVDLALHVDQEVMDPDPPYCPAFIA